jgi:hypothetical protein
VVLPQRSKNIAAERPVAWRPAGLPAAGAGLADGLPRGSGV